MFPDFGSTRTKKHLARGSPECTSTSRRRDASHASTARQNPWASHDDDDDDDDDDDEDDCLDFLPLPNSPQ